MPTETEYIDAVENGARTSEEVADALGMSYGYTARKLKELAEEKQKLVREMDGKDGFVYRLPTTEEALSPAESGAETEPATTPGAEGDDGLMPVVRDYDWDHPDYKADPAEYFSSNGELARITAALEARDVTGQPVRAAVSGPTGCGKTTLAEVIASRQDAVFFQIQMSHDVTDGDLFGSPSFAGGDTMWVDGPVTKALLASQEREVVVLIDEVNRAPAHVKNSLFSVLDHRGSVRLDGPRGGEVIEGNPLNITILATMNIGPEFHGTERLDGAEKSRYTAKYSVDYLAADTTDDDGIEREAELLVKRTPVTAEVARAMVEVAATIRTEAKDHTNTTVGMGIPTRTMLAWASQAYALHESGVDDPIVAAAHDTVVEVLYGYEGQEDEYDEVEGIIEDKLKGFDFESGVRTADADPGEVVRCIDCDHEEPARSQDGKNMLANSICPECGSADIEVN